MLDRLTIFAWLLAFANIAHQLTYSGWLQGEDALGLPLAVAAVALLLRPASIALLLVLVTLRLAYCAYHLPFLHNHILLEGFVCAGVLAGLAPALIRLRRLGDFSVIERDALFESFAGFLRLTLLLVYVLAFLHKLNVDFFDLEVGCGTRFLLWASERYPFLPTADWARLGTTVFTLMVEGGIPLLLLFRRTRAAGIIIGIGFHTMVGIHPLGVYTFSALMVVLLYCWTPPGLPAAAEVAYRQFRHLTARLSGRVLALGGIGFTLVLASVFMTWKGKYLFSTGLALWCSWSVVIAAAYLGALATGRMVEPATATLMRMSRATHWLLALIVAVNGISPYLGLKTRTSLTMHSNLRTEGSGWNHLFLPASSKIFEYQEDLVEIVESDLPEMQAQQQAGQSLPYFEFRRRIRIHPDDFYVVYVRDGETFRFEKRNGEGSDPVLMEKPFWLLEKLLYFNETDTTRRQSCRYG